MPVVLELIAVGAKMVGTVLKDEKAVWKDTFNPETVRGRKGLRDTAKATDEQVLDWIGQARALNGRLFSIVLAADAVPDTPVLTVRGVEQPASQGSKHEINESWVRAVLPTVPIDHVAEWKGAELLCCLDIDYHDRTPPSRDLLTTLLHTRVTPRPLAWHFSRSGGLHLFYVAVPPYNAEELAAIAALRFRAFDPTAGLELKTVVRGPGKEPVTFASTQDVATEFAQWLGAPDFDNDERDAWLDKEGMTVGGRYEHDKCPINPTPGYASKGNPVTVSEQGIFCHKCAGAGMALGSRKSGFAPWSSLLGAPSAGDLGVLVRNIIHWGHAKWVLKEQYGMPLTLARLAYSAALKAYHAGTTKEGLLPLVFNFHTDDMARVSDQWTSVEALYSYPKDIKGLVSALPAACYVDGEGKIKQDPAAVTELGNPKNLARYGYANIKVVHGFKMAATFLTPGNDRTCVAVVNPRLAARGTKFIPRYLPRSQRMSEAEAWAMIETVAPRIDRKLVEAAICAFASAQETQSGLLPIVFVTGATGTAKTSTIKFAGGIYGAQTGDVIFEPEPARFRQSIMTGARSGPAVLFNEVLKDSARGRHALTPKEALDPILNLTPDSQSWVAYMGPMKMGRPPAMFLTEPVCPLDLRDEAQLARRIRHYRVFDTKREWPATIGAAGLGSELDMLRTVSPQMNRACDSILSFICDRWFAEPRTWDDIADSLGVRTIQDSQDFTDMTPWLREFFRLVCAAPDLDGRNAAVYSGGYKRICRSDGVERDSVQDKLLTVYGMFVDGQSAGDWTQSRRLGEKDWAAIIGTDQHVWFDTKTDGSAVYVRFRVGPEGKATGVNQQIVDPSAWEALL